MFKTKRKNKSKEDITKEMEYEKKVSHIKDIVKQIYPTLETVDSIYDAQTVVNALSGFILAHLENKLQQFKMSDIIIDLSMEDDSAIKTAVLALAEMLADEPAKETSETLERLGKTLQTYSSHMFMKQPMSVVSLNDIVS